ncbi:MAG: hypothetical protein IT292_03385 [Deltaproteobacteria bacterium]|nr:hypothetical protein [Deltaproteobacteria bacterium]
MNIFKFIAVSSSEMTDFVKAYLHPPIVLLRKTCPLWGLLYRNSLKVVNGYANLKPGSIIDMRRHTFYLFSLIYCLAALLLGCGGSGNGGEGAKFNGNWEGTMRGSSCLGNISLERDVVYRLDSASQEAGEVVELTDGFGNYYKGNVAVTHEQGLGFMVELVDQKAAGEFPRFIRLTNVTDSQAQAETLYNISTISPYGCNYSLTAVLYKIP